MLPKCLSKALRAQKTPEKTQLGKDHFIRIIYRYFIKCCVNADPIFISRVGKIKRDSFLELVRSSSSVGEGEQIRTGKLNVTELYRNNQKPETEGTRGEETIRVGKLNTKVSILRRRKQISLTMTINTSGFVQ